jgi:hypothetical protein
LVFGCGRKKKKTMGKTKGRMRNWSFNQGKIERIEGIGGLKTKNKTISPSLLGGEAVGER